MLTASSDLLKCVFPFPPDRWSVRKYPSRRGPALSVLPPRHLMCSPGSTFSLATQQWRRRNCPPRMHYYFYCTEMWREPSWAYRAQPVFFSLFCNRCAKRPITKLSHRLGAGLFNRAEACTGRRSAFCFPFRHEMETTLGDPSLRG